MTFDAFSVLGNMSIKGIIFKKFNYYSQKKRLNNAENYLKQRFSF